MLLLRRPIPGQKPPDPAHTPIPGVITASE
jgi:hypothetical protein